MIEMYMAMFIFTTGLFATGGISMVWDEMKGL